MDERACHDEPPVARPQDACRNAAAQKVVVTVRQQSNNQRRLRARTSLLFEAPRASNLPSSRCPYREQNEAKALGAKWDRQEQAWYVPAGADVTAFSRWAQVALGPALLKFQEQRPVDAAPHVLRGRRGRQYLAVSYEDREAVKAAGAE